MTSTIELVHQEIKRFLASSEPEVLCIRGQWGVGKTYSWKRILKETKPSEIHLDRYAYVSLFGLNSLDELKYFIFECTVPKSQVAETPSVDTFKSTIHAAEGWGRKSAWLLKFVPFVERYFAAAMPSVSLLIKNQIVCIDDLERKGEDLALGDVLGLISFLKEERNCKLVLLLNDEKLGDDAQEDFKSYLEKVVDISLKFAPTPNESASIAIQGNSELETKLREACCALRISNIRIIEKIKRMSNQLHPLLKSFHPEVLQSALKSVVLFTWVIHSGEGAPTIEYITQKRSGLYAHRVADDNFTEDEQIWGAMLDAFGFSHCDGLDLVLLSGVQQGVFDTSEIRVQASKSHELLVAQDGMNLLKDAWEHYHGSFDDNADLVVDSIFTGYVEVMAHVDAGGLAAAVRLLKDLDASDKASDLINAYVAAHQGNEEAFDPDLPFDRIDDEEILSAFKSERRARPARTPLEALSQIATGGWGSRDIDALSALSVDDFYSFLKSLHGQDFRDALRGLTDFRRIRNHEDEAQQICRIAEEALRRIGSESLLNRRRVRKYGIVID